MKNTFNLQQFLIDHNLSLQHLEDLQDFSILKLTYHKSKATAIIELENDSPLKFEVYEALYDYFFYDVLESKASVEFIIHSHYCDLSVMEMKSYVDEFLHINRLAIQVTIKLSNDRCILLVNGPNEEEILSNYLEQLKQYCRRLGLYQELEIEQLEKKEYVVETVQASAGPKAEVMEAPKTIQRKMKKSDYPVVTIDELIEETNNVAIEVDVFKVEINELKSGKVIASYYVEDEKNATMIKCFESAKFTKDFLTSIKKGKRYKFTGNYRYDNFAKDYCFFAEEIELLSSQEQLVDDAPRKRIELDTHSNRSEMDSVCDVEEIVQAAFKMGHDAVAITDSMNVQSFPKAQRAVKNLLKANPERQFKMLYGVQFNVVNERLTIVRNATNQALKDLEYVILDLETTGLSMTYDYTIEFGAVVYRNGMEIERHDFFIKPPFAISPLITKLTHITNDDVKDQGDFKELAAKILAILKDRVIVAHNATFDYGFLNAELTRNGYEKLTNPVIDTLDLSKAMFKDKRSYRLGRMAKNYGVVYDEENAHRADYDAEVLARIFSYMLKDLEKESVQTLEDLANFQSEDAFAKNFTKHVNVLVRNKEGLKDLFKLVSISNTQTLAVTGKASSKGVDSEFLAEPRVFKSTLNQFREHLLIGSSVYTGEVFDAAAFSTQEELENLMQFYDYIEVQPLENYRMLIDLGKIASEEILIDIIKRIIKTAQKLNKIVVATGDVRYVLAKQKILRDVYINTPGIGGARHPLYIFDKEKRSTFKTPMQRFLNTKEMLEAFQYLGDANLIQRIVIDNTHRIAEMCEPIYPIHSGLYPPKIENSDQLLTEIVEKKAKELYGDNPDLEIRERIDRELHAIISNGYGVVYYVSHLLVKKSNDDGYLVGSRGSVGSSIIATLAGITEVNPLRPHYRCPKCKYFRWEESFSGYNLETQNCPNCSTQLIGDGQDIPFETFLGFEGDKVPDIDLNFSSEYQDKAHLFTREVFGEDHVFRAGTISTVAEKTAYGYVKGYCEEKNILNMSRAMRERLASGCENVKRTTGQHPGGIIVIPQDMDVYDFTPIQYPANSLDATWKTTHFDFHEIHDNVLKFDILGHVDPTAMKLLETISGIDPKTIPMNDPRVMSIFNSPKELHIVEKIYDEKTGACGLPEFGTRFVRGILELTKPNTFSDLVQISGLSHGTDVWNNNAKDLIEHNGILLKDVIGCRDDIMSTLIRYQIPSKTSFTIMESVRKGKGLTSDQEALMLEHKVPQWYIDSCKKIKYMFPKAHAVAYVIMAVRVAWFKVYYPIYYYISFFSLRCTAYEIESMTRDAAGIKARMTEILNKMAAKDINNPVSKKEKDLLDTLEICFEMACRGYRITNIDLNLSLAVKFRVNPKNEKEIIPPFVVLDGLGEAAAQSIVDAREEREFTSKEDLMKRTQVSKTIKEKFDKLGVLMHLDESDQLSLF